ncbi:MAG: hypothetical protein CMH57_01260 [Myxococcales bacterium]|nr:hypothetical protein [Myxococcales bacterium]
MSGVGRAEAWLRAVVVCGLVASVACGGGDSGDDGVESVDSMPPGPVPSVNQGGVQDFGAFRAIVEAGGLPGPETLDSVGFFAEHHVTLPSPDCGEDLCVHGLMGSWVNFFDGSRCDTVMIGVNTAVDPGEVERPPMHLVVLLETSAALGDDTLALALEGLYRMRQELTEEDRVTLIRFDTTARVLIEGVAAGDDQLTSWLDNMRAGGDTNLYDGLRLAYERAEALDDGQRQRRVMLISGSAPDTGIASRERLVEMSAAYNAAGTGLTIVGVSAGADVPLLEALAEAGGGQVYFPEDRIAIAEVFVEEVNTALTPVAEEVQIAFSGEGYQVQALYGARNARFESPERLTLDIASLYVAHRNSADDDDQGRRGGGGFMLLKLDAADAPADFDPESVGEVTLEYRVPGQEQRIAQTVTVQTPYSPDDAHEDAYFESDGVEKAFVTLNVFVGFLGAAERSADGDLGAALAILERLEGALTAWLVANPDGDLEDDLRVLKGFKANLLQAGANPSPNTATAWDPWYED